MLWVDAVRFVKCEAKNNAKQMALEDILLFNDDTDIPICLSVKKYRDWTDTPNVDMAMEGNIRYQRESAQVEKGIQWLLDSIYNE